MTVFKTEDASHFFDELFGVIKTISYFCIQRVFVMINTNNHNMFIMVNTFIQIVFIKINKQQ